MDGVAAPGTAALSSWSLSPHSREQNKQGPELLQKVSREKTVLPGPAPPRNIQQLLWLSYLLGLSWWQSRCVLQVFEQRSM